MQPHSIPNRLLAIGALFALAPALPLAAQSNLLTNNPSFEIPALVDGATSIGIQDDPNAGVLNSWVVVGNTVSGLNVLTERILTENPTDTQYFGTSAGSSLLNPLNGTQVASFRSSVLDVTGSATQVSNVLLSLNTRFTLTVGVGNPMDSRYQGYEITLLAGGTVLGTSFEGRNGTSVPDGTFVDKTISLVLDPLDPNLSKLVGTALSINLSVPGVPLGTLGTTNFGTDFDNVRLTATAVPEPGVTAYVGLGLLGLVGAQCFRRHRGVSLRA